MKDSGVLHYFILNPMVVFGMSEELTTPEHITGIVFEPQTDVQYSSLVPPELLPIVRGVIHNVFVLLLNVRDVIEYL